MTHQETNPNCALCGKVGALGPHFYGFKQIASWNTMICEGCAASNWDGIAPENHQALMTALKARGVSLQLNEKGRLLLPVG